MDLILWRHGEAEDAAGKLPDTKRRLTERGEKQVRAMAHWLRTHLPQQVRVLAGPAQRTRMTAQALELPFEIEPRIGIGADAADLLAAIDWPEHSGTIVVVGHRHTLGRVAALLVSGVEADWTVKKGGLWWLSNRRRRDETRTVLRAVVDPGVIQRADVAPAQPPNTTGRAGRPIVATGTTWNCRPTAIAA